MTSPPLDSTHGLTTSGAACNHCLWETHMIECCWAWHAIISFGWQTRSNGVKRDKLSPSLDSTHSRTSSGVACYHRLYTAHTVERRWTWHDITAFGQQTWSNDVGRDMPSPPLDRTHGRTTSSVAFHYGLWAAHMVEQRRAWHAIIALRRQTWSDDVRRYMPSPPLDSTCGRTTTSVV